MDTHQIIIRPIITEKAMADAQNGKFTFEVVKNANKEVIKIAVEKAFEVNVTAVATSIVKGKTKRVGPRRTEKQYSSWKKAIVSLKEGQKIGLFDLGEKK